MAKSTIPSPVLTELNRQFNQELGASHAYLALAAWCEAQNLKGFAKFFHKQSGEERERTRASRLISRGTSVEKRSMEMQDR